MKEGEANASEILFHEMNKELALIRALREVASAVAQDPVIAAPALLAFGLALFVAVGLLLGW